MGSMVPLYCHRAKSRAIAFANELLDESGALIDLEEVEPPKVFIPEEYNSSDIEEHFSRVLNLLKTDRELRGLIDGFSPFLFDPQVEALIAITLGISGPLRERHIKWAVLSALLTPLRQSVGSCFATAPAILVHEEQPHQFLRDLQDLMVMGKLSRIFGGVEYTVPISPSPGLGNLKRPYFPGNPAFEIMGIPAPKHGQSTFLELIEEHVPPATQQEAKWHFVAYSDHLLLKVWEFTVASFVDVKTEFSRWNLYSSLGLHPEEKGGIGGLIYGHLERRLEEVNEELSKQQGEVEIAFDQVRATESLMRGVSSEQDARRLKGEHQSRLFHLRAVEDVRNRLAETSKRISEFFSFMIEKIVEHFPQHFQEVYDAEMQEIEATPYDDAPAGFRLLYKHGRAHVGAWTFISDGDEYIDALKNFFIAIENSLIHECEWEQGKEEIGQIVTAIVHHIRTEDFLVTAFYRMAKAHKVPLQKVPLEKMEKKPWAYTSGGTMPTLIKTYFRREGSLSEEARWVESPQDLCIFLLDTLKMLSPRILDPFLANPKKRMLTFSPTHAYSLLPGIPLFAEGWQDKGFTYTWVRDRIVLPRRDYFEGIRLSVDEQLYLVQELAKRVPPDQAYQLQSHFRPSSDMGRLNLYRNQLPPFPFVDSFLFEMLPIITPKQAATFIAQHELDVKPPKFMMGRRHFHDLVVRDSHDVTARLMEDAGLAPPSPLRFADSNWEKYDFAFVVSPFSGELELWRTDKIGLTGTPMREWQPLIDGSVQEPWGVFLRPYEYVS